MNRVPHKPKKLMKTTRHLIVIAAALAWLLPINLHATTLHVWPDSPSPGGPYDQWTNAAHDIQTAVDAASPGDTVLATNGVYATGGLVTPGYTLSNRVTITKLLSVQSVNGPAVTIILGQGPIGPGACRCVYVTNGATLAGFTLMGGATHGDGDPTYDQSGGGLLLDHGGVASNCVLRANAAFGGAGGPALWYGGLVVDSTIDGNTAPWGGGAYLTGGGMLSGCLVTSNTASSGAGGLCAESGGMISNCVVVGNSVADGGWWGGGMELWAHDAGSAITAVGCLVATNSTPGTGGGFDATGEFGGTVTVIQCQVLGNWAGYAGGGHSIGQDNGGAATVGHCRIEGNWGTQGGGIQFYSGGVVESCVLAHNGAWLAGGAQLSSGSSLLNSAVYDNQASDSGGGLEMAGACTVHNCTIHVNRAGRWGSGVFFSDVGQTLENSIVWAGQGVPLFEGKASTNLYNCIRGWTNGGTGNIADDPLLIDACHIAAGSPCIGAGSAAVASDSDVDGRAWKMPPAIGCSEYDAGSTTGTLTVVILPQATTVATGYSCRLASEVVGNPTLLTWSFGDGTTQTNAAVAFHLWSTPGDYPVTLTVFNDSHPDGVSATVALHVLTNAICLVNPASTNPQPPYASWDTAAINIQDAVAACIAGGTVLVTNGTYSVGSYLPPVGSLLSRVVVTNDIVLRSVNGPELTTIQGPGDWNGSQYTNGPSAIRCVYMNAGQISGFTLQGGYTLTTGAGELDQGGGGAYGAGAVLTNCVIAGNASVQFGGGVCIGTLWNCLLASNYTVNAGGGAYRCTLHNCTVTGNQSASWGGGAHDSTAYDTFFVGNQASAGGAAGYSSLVRCTVGTNSATFGGGLCNGAAQDSTFINNTGYWGGGANNGQVTNCTFLTNTATGSGGAMCAGTMVGCTATGNQAVTYDGGGISGVSAYNSTLSYNQAARNGGGFWGDTDHGLAGCQVIGNVAGQFGGGLYLDHGGAVWNSVIVSNQSLNYGGGLSLNTNGSVANCQISGNLANANGGGVWSADASGVISNCVVSGCLAGGNGGGLYQGTAFNCQIISNSAYIPGIPDSNRGGGTYDSLVYDSTLRGNYASVYGGGAYLGALYRCTLSGNSAWWGGGVCNDGSRSVVVYDSLLVGNSAADGGAVFDCTLYGCTLTGNSASTRWGGVHWGTLYNSIAYGNSGGDVYADAAYFSCAPELTAGVNGNITGTPLFANPAAGDYTLNLSSPCINSGTNFNWMTNSTDLAGNPRILGGQVDMGAYEFNPLQVTGAISAVLSVDYPNATPASITVFAAMVVGRANGCVWQWDDGASVSNLFSVSHAFSTLGWHTATFTVWNLNVTNIIQITVNVIPPTTRYVSLAGAHTPPFTNWFSAATNIQAAIDAAIPGDTVLVTNGVFATGGAVQGGSSNRVALTKPLTVRSVNGPAPTIILADGTLRGVFVSEQSLLAGFTVTNGAAPLGGGVWVSSGSVVSNCTLVGNSAPSGDAQGGGVWNQGTLYDCLIANNLASKGGGGVSGGTLERCVLTNNSSRLGNGGGALNATLYNCLLAANNAGFVMGGSYKGGGASGGALFNCTVVSNTVYGRSRAGAGTWNSVLWNCVVSGNGGANNVDGGIASFTCTTPLPTDGIGNITNAPLFMNEVAGDFRLAAGSPCINAGTNFDWMLLALDLAGLPRIAGGTVDMGAYEFQSSSVNLGFSTLTAPLLLHLEWPSVVGTSYQLQSATNLPTVSWTDEGASFTGTGGVLQTNLAITVGPARFFRLRLSY